MAEALTEMILEHDRPCVVCGYNLRGLPFEGKCPECGSPVQRSLQGNLLKFSAPEYLAALHRGVFLIQVAVIAQVLAKILGIPALFLAGALAGVAPGGSPTAFWVIGAVQTGAGILEMAAWWMLSAPDPAFIGTGDGSTARKVVRVAVVINAIGSAAALLPDTTAAVRNFSAATPLVLLTWAAIAAAYIAWVVWFFAAMRYLQWLAPRLPNGRVLERARLMMWLGPLLYTVGRLVCVGPLVALVLYYNLLSWVREDLQRIRSDQSLREAAGLPL